MKTTFGDKYLGRLNIFIRSDKIKIVCESVDNDPLSSRPPTKKKAKIRNLVRSDHLLTISEITDELDLCFDAVQLILLSIVREIHS